MKKYLLPFTSAAVLILGAGCSTAPAPSAPGEPLSEPSPSVESSADVVNDTGDYTPVYTVEACDLITADEASVILGGELIPAYTEEGSDPAKKYCRYVTSQESGVSRLMEISVYEDVNMRNSLYEWPLDEYFSRFKTGHMTQPEQYEELQGLGEDAYLWSGTVRVLNMPYMIWIAVRGFSDEATNMNEGIKAAKKALERLP
ncbi:hypothetical protein HS096_04540 [candidate division WWE3 bacterium]|uniref:DUF3558 domain-containing protein n=1 Tax=candidate division WWE3 bacterium TaxID=2053526 RepID=A0A928Y5Z3_UNCKA|nr:hypothetical protein [candidate division WWE3 bacterium]